MPKSPKTYIILLNYNGYDDTAACIASLRRIDYDNFEIVLVDNHSTDGSAERLRRLEGLHFIQSEKNLGFAGGCNLGIEFALDHKVDYILLLNNDTIVAAGFLSVMTEHMDLESRIGIIGPKILYNNEENRIWSAGGGISTWTKRTFQYGENRIDRGQYDTLRDVDFISGCCMLIRREVLDDIGLFDPEYFMYYEDVDYCLRAKDAGWRIVFEPGALIRHTAGAASSRSFIDYYRMRNAMMLLTKRYGFSKARIITTMSPVLIERVARAILRKLVRGDSEALSTRFSAICRGWLDGI
jgi:GT2 family glycosyltransferase